MKKLYSTVLMFAMFVVPLQTKAEGSAIKLEFSGTSMTIELSQQPKIFTENGNLMLKTNSMTLTLTLPCKATFVGKSDGNDDGIINIHNNEDKTPINVYSIDGKKVGTIKDKNEVLSLERGVFIINGKKILIK